MATKISELTSASTLDGSELLPIVQGGVTKSTSITDLVSGGELPAYSTSETLTTERWINGKPIYRKTINGSFLGAGVYTANQLVSSDVETHVDVQATLKQATGNDANAFGHHSFGGTSYYVLQWSIDGTSIYSRADHVEWFNLPWIVTVHYTKTTDTAASPVAGVTVTGGDSDWTSVTPTATWEDWNAHDWPLQYRKTADGTVHIRGLAKCLATNNTLIFTLPTGYRPSNKSMFIVNNNNSTNSYTNRLDIFSTGEVQVAVSPGTDTCPVPVGGYVSVCCSFHAS